MKSQSLLVVGLLVAVAMAYTNTTDFYSKQLNIDPKDMHFQGYAGTHTTIQDIRKSIGTDPQEPQACSINSLAPWVQTSKCKTPKYLSSSGFKEDLVAAHNLVCSLKTDRLESKMARLGYSLQAGISSGILFSSISL